MGEPHGKFSSSSSSFKRERKSEIGNRTMAIQVITGVIKSKQKKKIFYIHGKTMWSCYRNLQHWLRGWEKIVHHYCAIMYPFPWQIKKKGKVLGTRKILCEEGPLWAGKLDGKSFCLETLPAARSVGKQDWGRRYSRFLFLQCWFDLGSPTERCCMWGCL